MAVDIYPASVGRSKHPAAASNSFRPSVVSSAFRPAVHPVGRGRFIGDEVLRVRVVDRSSRASQFGWRVEVGDSALLSALAYALPSVFGGAVLLAAALFGSVALAAVRAGAFGRAIGVATLLVVAVLVHRWFLPAAVGTDLLDPLRPRYSRRGVVLGSVAGAAVLYASSRLHPLAPFVTFAASWLPFALVAGFPTEGRADPTEGVLVVDGDQIPLASVESYRTVPFRSLVLCRVSYSRGVPTAPRTLVLPCERFDGVRSLLDAARDGDGDVAGASVIGAAERWILVAFGVGALAVGPAFWVLVPREGAAVALYAGALFGAFGAVFLWYAATA